MCVCRSFGVPTCARTCSCAEVLWCGDARRLVQLCDSGFAMEEGRCIKCASSGSYIVLKTPGIILLSVVLSLLALPAISMGTCARCKVRATVVVAPD
jgi:hypothetical protein